MAKTKREQANDDPVAYLKAAGWRQLSIEERPSIGRCWIQPPQEQNAQAFREIELPPLKRGGRPRIVRQHIVQPQGTWYFTLEEAVAAQLQADALAAQRLAAKSNTPE